MKRMKSDKPDKLENELVAIRAKMMEKLAEIER